jgi:predicted HicB family RNase H-like nuclease
LSEKKSELVRINSTLHRKVKVAAARAGISMKEWVDGAMKDKLQARKVETAA